MQVYPEVGNQNPLNFASDNGSYAALTGAPSNLPKRLSGATELTKKGVRRTSLKIEIPQLAVDAAGVPVPGVPPLGTVTAYLVVVTPVNEGLQLAAPGAFSQTATVLAALRVLTTVATGSTPALGFDDTAMRVLTNPWCRASNGIEPIDEYMTYGYVPA